MMRSLLLASVLAVSALAAHAGGLPSPPPSSAVRTDTRAFVGLNWTFGSGGGTAEGVLGVARVKTDETGDSQGAKLSLHLPFANGVSFGKVKLTGMTGERDRMVEAGLGFGSGRLFGTAGLWAPYVNGGVDVGFDGSFEGYAGVHSLDAWELPRFE